MIVRSLRFGSTAALVAGAALTLAAAPPRAQKGLPDGFVQILPRGRIPAIDSPRFVPAEEARIPPDAWVLGLVLSDEARAYSLNLLNQHEIVNDRVGGNPIAAVW